MLLFLFLIAAANGQQIAYCADHGEGPCIAETLCPDGATCIYDYVNTFCCENSKIIFYDCCGDSGLGDCLGNFCPDGAECIYDGKTSPFCCSGSQIIRNCTGTFTTGSTANPTLAPTTPATLYDCCANGGIGDCLGNFCPNGAECIYDGKREFCCENDQIIRNCTGYYNETTGPTPAHTTRLTTPATSPSTRTTTTTPSTTTTTSGTPSTLQCQCDTMSAWVDMIFVIDASASTGATGLNEMWGMAGTMLELFNVQKTGYTGTQYTSRVGIITYGNSANVLYPLGSLDNDDIDNLFDLPFNNDPRANLEAGIQAAVQQFNGPNHRSNARRVIIVMAAVFNPEGENAPNKTATTFKEQDGVLMVYNYVPAHGLESPILASLASAGYFFSTTLNSHYTDIALALCDANCFCRDLLHPYGLSSPRQYPTQGCYMQIAAESNYARGSNNCKTNYFNGIVAIDENSAKTAFLRALLPSSSFYIGLKYNTINGRWEWPDGTVPGSYQPWAIGQAPDGSVQQCAYINANGQWQQVDCRNGYPYVCEIMPCDSIHYCG